VESYLTSNPISLSSVSTRHRFRGEILINFEVVSYLPLKRLGLFFELKN
jgi:hypothetical protein